jgi:hypothetical protein
MDLRRDPLRLVLLDEMPGARHQHAAVPRRTALDEIEVLLDGHYVARARGRALAINQRVIGQPATWIQPWPV